MQKDEMQPGAEVRHLPVHELLNPVQAAAYLGLAPRLLASLHLFRCGPRRLKIHARPFYRKSDLETVRRDWCAAVHVRAEDRLLPPENPDVPLPAQDPLMRILALRAIRHRVVVSIFWIMAIAGGAICLTLY